MVDCVVWVQLKTIAGKFQRQCLGKPEIGDIYIYNAANDTGNIAIGQFLTTIDLGCLLRYVIMPVGALKTGGPGKPEAVFKTDFGRPLCD